MNSSGVTPEMIRGFQKIGPAILRLSIEMERAASEIVTGAVDLVHQHVVFTGISRVTHVFHKEHAIPTVVAPHGSLERWALEKSHWKKRIATTIYERRNLREASCIHACSHQELAGMRDYGLTNPIAVIPNGISDIWLNSTGNAGAFRQRFGIPKEKRIMLFLSRITPVKGLPMLIHALHLIRQELDDWILVIAGIDEFDHQNEVQEQIRHLRLEKYVLFAGLLLDQDKRDAFAASDLFVLPTKREAAPVVVLEALGAGVPVVTTKGAPWENLVTYNCGWWVDVDPNAIGGALSQALRSNPEKLLQMGKRGRELVSEQYSWVNSAKISIELYQWLLGQRERPSFVDVG